MNRWALYLHCHISRWFKTRLCPAFSNFFRTTQLETWLDKCDTRRELMCRKRRYNMDIFSMLALSLDAMRVDVANWIIKLSLACLVFSQLEAWEDNWSSVLKWKTFLSRPVWEAAEWLNILGKRGSRLQQRSVLLNMWICQGEWETPKGMNIMLGIRPQLPMFSTLRYINYMPYLKGDTTAGLVPEANIATVD